MLCVFFALLLVITHSSNKLLNYLLAAFLFIHALIPLNELMLWGSVFKLHVRESIPEFNFIFEFAYYIDGVLLYFYVKSLIFRGSTFRRKDLLHLIPLGIYIVFMMLAFYRYPTNLRVEWVRNETFTYSEGHVVMDFFCRVLRASYCLMSLKLIVQYKDILRATRSNIKETNILWLSLLVIGFLVVTASESMLSFFKIIGVFFGYEFQHSSFNIYEILGLAGYYFSFFLVISLVFSSMRYFIYFDKVKPKDADHLNEGVPSKLLNPEIGEKIDEKMRANKFYLNSDLSLSVLAKELSMSTRDLSMYINRNLAMNFWEFINAYRVEEAQQYLAENSKTITDIYLETGFSSKSVFNTFFKKKVGMTPSEYRRKIQESTAN